MAEDTHSLEFSLEERREKILWHYKRMDSLNKRLSRYVEDVEFARNNGLNSSVVSHLTYNLLLTISKETSHLNEYDYLRCRYLLDDEYNEAYNIWKSFSENSSAIKSKINEIEDGYFDNDIDITTFINDIVPPNLKNMVGFDFTEDEKKYIERIELDGAEIIAYVSIASSVGVGLLKCLRQKLNNTEGWLEDIKNAYYFDLKDDEDYEFTYLINYNLYKNKYWPQEGERFRNSVRMMSSNQPITIDFLEKQLYDEKRQFVTNQVGFAWRDFFKDKRLLYNEIKRIKLEESQWKYFFMNVCRFEEYDRWIEELRNPPESEEDRQKRERLLKTNKVFTLRPSKSKHHVDILLLYVFIRDRFITEKMFVYEWYALYYILKREGVITSCTVAAFTNQMNQKEWFADVKKKCSANEINTHGFLTDKSPDIWDVNLKPHGNHASENSVSNILRKYYDLEDTIDEIYI